MRDIRMWIALVAGFAAVLALGAVAECAGGKCTVYSAKVPPEVVPPDGSPSKLKDGIYPIGRFTGPLGPFEARGQLAKGVLTELYIFFQGKLLPVRPDAPPPKEVEACAAAGVPRSGLRYRLAGLLAPDAEAALHCVSGQVVIACFADKTSGQVCYFYYYCMTADAKMHYQGRTLACRGKGFGEGQCGSTPLGLS